MDPYAAKYLTWAVALGAISAVSLPLGSILGLQTKPRPLTISVLAAFGGGALIAALSVELVAPTALALVADDGSSVHGDPHTNFYSLVAGAAAGGVLFSLLNELVNARGGFLRRTSSTIAYLTARRRDRDLRVLEELSGFPLLDELSPEHVNSLVGMIRPGQFSAGDVLAEEGSAGTEFFFIVEGVVEATAGAQLKTSFGPGNALGAIPLIMGAPHPGRLTAREPVTGYSLSKTDFDRLRSLSPSFDEAARQLATRKLEQIEGLIAERTEKSIDWLRQAERALETGAQVPEALQLKEAREEHHGAALAIWLGVLIDGIPESFVIGAGLLAVLHAHAELLGSASFADVVPYTLIAALFLSNLPEALASSANMRRQGWGKRRIFLLWFSLMVITAAGAGAGFLLADSLGHTWLAFAEGLAAGAMLTMVAAAMIPDAVQMGKASAVGLGTLAGFLAAISFKLLE
jgi:CRP-like cAMP-binding protein